ncbi:MAG TPA: hypothetical protein VHW23_09765 [Kofleriaceae bacterium]|nr:hypothetical protein [Kofleriaceae bacterium]
MSGQLSLIAARGDARVSVPDFSLWVAAPDGSFAVVAEPGGAVTVWRSGDGVLLQRVMCPRPAPVPELIAVSPDLRWVVVSGGRPDVRLGDRATCIADLQAGTARLVQGQLDSASFDLATRTVFGRDHGFRLDTGEELHCGGDSGGAPDAAFLRSHHITEWDGGREVAMSHDGRYLAAWSRRANLGVWDLTTGKRLWTRRYDGVRSCTDWRFTPDDARLEAVPGRAPAVEEIATATGLVTPLPGDAVAVRPPFPETELPPRGDPIALGNSYLLTPQVELRQALAYPEPPAWRAVVARSADGTARAELELGVGLLLERGERCFTLGINLLRENPVSFSPDGALLYAVRSHPYRAWEDRLTMLGVWRTDTGALVRGLEMEEEYAAVLIPGAGRVAFGSPGNPYQVGSRLHVVDALGGREVATLEATSMFPRVPDARGTTWLLPAGDRRGQMYRWELGDPRGPRPFLADLPGQVAIAAFSPDGRRIAAAMTDGAIAVWSRDTERVTATVAGAGRIDRLAFSPDGRWLASAGDGGVRVTDVVTGAALGAVALTTDRATLLWWSPDSDRLVIDTQRRFEITVAPSAALERDRPGP